MVPDENADNGINFQMLTEDDVNRTVRTGGTFLHSSRTRPSHLPHQAVPPHLKDRYKDDINDVTPSVLENLEYLGVDYLIPIGGDDTLSYAYTLHTEGVKVVAIPKTTMCRGPTTASALGPASHAPSRWPTH
jgi:6-phosphofructokinase 1